MPLTGDSVRQGFESPFELELELIQTHMAQKSLLRVEVLRVCALKSKCGWGYWISKVCKSLVCRSSRDLKSERGGIGKGLS